MQPAKRLEKTFVFCGLFVQAIGSRRENPNYGIIEMD